MTKQTLNANLTPNTEHSNITIPVTVRNNSVLDATDGVVTLTDRNSRVTKNVVFGKIRAGQSDMRNAELPGGFERADLYFNDNRGGHWSTGGDFEESTELEAFLWDRP